MNQHADISLPRSAKTREKLLQTAARILEDDGLEHLNTNALADAAGVSVPTVYRNFRNKEDVLICLARSFVESEGTWLASVFDEFCAAPDLRQAMTLVIDLYWTAANSYPGVVPLRSAMRVWPDLRDVEEESLANSARWLTRALCHRYSALSEESCELAARYVVEVVCAAIDRCYTLDKSEQAWRLDMLKLMVVEHLAASLDIP